MKNKIPLKPIVKLVCPKCNELQVKMYPYSSFTFQGGAVPECLKCLNKQQKKIATVPTGMVKRR